MLGEFLAKVSKLQENMRDALPVLEKECHRILSLADVVDVKLKSDKQ